jgi:hypothetical protein
VNAKHRTLSHQSAAQHFILRRLLIAGAQKGENTSSCTQAQGIPIPAFTEKRMKKPLQVARHLQLFIA